MKKKSLSFKKVTFREYKANFIPSFPVLLPPNMSNESILSLLESSIKLMELHEENPFKIRSLQNALFHLEKIADDLLQMTQPQLELLEGVGKGIATKIIEIKESGTTTEYRELLAKTPAGVVDMLSIKGIGPKKVRTLWKELNLETTEALYQACQENKIAKLKGFGEKTQENIKAALEFTQAQKGKFLYADIETLALDMEKNLAEKLKPWPVALTGELRRQLEIVETLQFLVSTDQPAKVFASLDQWTALQKDEQISNPFVWRGIEKISQARVEVKTCEPAKYPAQQLIHSASNEYLSWKVNEQETLYQYLRKNTFESEEKIFESLNLSFVPPELRETREILDKAKSNELPNLVNYEALKGILHNHSTYSDGKHSLEQMAIYCRDLGYQYLGITDHSKTATYANGLQEFRIKEQHQEIEELNKKLAPFKIFKGIESDILNDGSLDYAPEVLSSFDFIIASVHSNLKMSEEKATERLLKAIENPYTTMLGHATGRLLLRREGYPIDHKQIIDACAKHEVIIEINANPWRLDIDWRWIPYALEQGVKISINPDAHETAGYQDMRYGWLAARKGGLTEAMTFNALSVTEIEAYFKQRKKAKGL